MNEETQMINAQSLHMIIDMKFIETITEEQIVENYKGIRFMLRCCKDTYLISRNDWKKLLDYAYQKYVSRLQMAVAFHAGFGKMKEGDIDE